MAKTLYFNLEDDIKTILARVKGEHSPDLVLVFPRRSYLFADAVNLKLLKKQLDVLRKNAAILTMDERGQAYAAEAGFVLKELPSRGVKHGMGDIKTRATERPAHAAKRHPAPTEVVAPAPAFVEEAETHHPKASHARTHHRTSHQEAAKSIPHVAVHDTIFSDVPYRPTNAYVPQEGRKRTPRTVWLGAAALVVLFLLIFTIVILPKATVVVHAKGDAIIRDVELSVGTNVLQADIAKLQLPAVSLERVLETEDKFQSTGKKEIGSKAVGNVRIFNLTGAPLSLKSKTTTLSAGGKSYVLTSDQNFIPATPAKQVTNPNAGRVAAVEAAQAGEGFNLPVNTRLEITNQVFGNKPQLLYAQVEDALTGGNSRFVSTIEEADLAMAQIALQKQLVDQLAAQLKNDGKMLPEKAYQSSVVSFTSDKPVGSETPTFTAKLQISLKGLAFEPALLTDLVRSRITQVLSDGSALQSADKDVLTFKVRQLDIAAGTMKLIVHVESKSYKLLDLAALQTGLKGKSRQEAEVWLSGRPEIDHASITLSPSWQSSIPRLQSHVSVTQAKE
ncbi:MAG: hypothetical protein JNK33_01650 [Candidatus Doudnabacteria bacterium]|nr:hypothetical protein [Candidatus Doudnabacteria bacterium]